MPIRNGKQYIDGLKDDRCVYVNGKLITDVTSYEPFSGVINQMAALYDLQHDARYQDAMTYLSPKDKKPVSTSFLLAKTFEEMQQRVRGESLRTDFTYGVMGRLPDYMLSLIHI